MCLESEAGDLVGSLFSRTATPTYSGLLHMGVGIPQPLCAMMASMRHLFFALGSRPLPPLASVCLLSAPAGGAQAALWALAGGAKTRGGRLSVPRTGGGSEVHGGLCIAQGACSIWVVCGVVVHGLPAGAGSYTDSRGAGLSRLPSNDPHPPHLSEWAHSYTLSAHGRRWARCARRRPWSGA